jgi:type I restriction enzyme M protein
MTKQSDLKKQIKAAEVNLDKQVLKRYDTLTEDEIKTLVVDDKWMMEVERLIKSEMDLISQRLAQRVKELTERYETPLPGVSKNVNELENKVSVHLKEMGYIWE